MLIRHDRNIELYRDRASNPEFRCVGRVSVTGRSDVASGVLIAPNWVLTAAHVADKGDPKDFEWDFEGRRERAIRHIFHPTYLRMRRRRKRYNGSELALVELDQPVNSVAPASRYAGCDEVGRAATLVGYGKVGDGLNGIHYPAVQERLAGENVIDSAGGLIGDLEISDCNLLMTFDSPHGTPGGIGLGTSLNLECSGSGGDSGGGVFIPSEGGWLLAAIIAGPVPFHGSDRNLIARGYGAVGRYVRISAVNEWVGRVIGMQIGNRMR